MRPWAWPYPWGSVPTALALMPMWAPHTLGEGSDPQSGTTSLLLGTVSQVPPSRSQLCAVQGSPSLGKSPSGPQGLRLVTISQNILSEGLLLGAASGLPSAIFTLK